MEEKDLKAKIQEKLDKRIENLLKKKELSESEYHILEMRLSEIKSKETNEKLCGSLITSMFSK